MSFTLKGVAYITGAGSGESNNQNGYAETAAYRNKVSDNTQRTLSHDKAFAHLRYWTETQ
jgi:hypothetical protein